MPVRGLLVGVGDFEDVGLAEGFTHDLEADREGRGFVRLGEPAGDADATDPREVGGDRKDVREVHLKRVVGFLTDLERGSGGGGGDDCVDLFEGIEEVLTDEGPGFLGLQVVGVVVSGTEDIGAEDDPAPTT